MSADDPHEDCVECQQSARQATTDAEALAEQIAQALSDSVGGWNKDTAAIQRSAAAVLPTIRKAQADAWDDGYLASRDDEVHATDTPNPYCIALERP